MASCIPTVYTAPITVGGGQEFQLTIDTGSTTMGVASNSCTNCGVTPIYTPGSTAVDQHQTGDSQFGTGSWTGEIYNDGVGGGTVTSTKMNFVAIGSQSQFFEPIQCGPTDHGTQGIIGLGQSAVALPHTTGFIDALVANDSMPDIFATELCDNGGTLWLGGYDSSATTAAVQYVPYATDQYAQEYYAVVLTSITVNGTTVPIASGQNTDTIVDTGTSVFLLGQTAFSALASAIGSDATFTQVFGGASFFSNQTNNPCKTSSLSQTELDAMLPSITLNFGSVSIPTTPTQSYLFGYGGQWCPALDAVPAGELPFASILGAPMLRSNITVFDREQKRVGFAPHTNCP